MVNPNQGPIRTKAEALDPLPAEDHAPIVRRPAPPASTGSSPTPQPARRSGAWQGWLALVGLIAAGAVIFFFLPGAAGEDEHLTSAKSILERYERSRSEPERNYRNPVYAEALDHLDHVATESKSWDEAQALAADVRRRTDEFLRRTEAANQEAESRVEERTRRNEEVFEAQRRAALTPKTSYPECELEGAGGPGHRHQATR